MNASSGLFAIMRVVGHQRFVVRKGFRRKIFEQIVTVVYLKKQQISQESTCVGSSF